MALSTLVRCPRRSAASSKASSHDALDLRARVPQRVDGRLDPVVLLASLRAAEVEAAGQLAHDQHVGAGAHLGTQRRGRVERGMGAHRAAGWRTAPARIAGRAARPRAASVPRGRPTAGRPPRRAGRHRRRGRRRGWRPAARSPVASIAAPPTSCSSQPTSNPKRAPAASTQRRAHVAHLGADPVAGKVGDAVLPHGWLPAGVGTGSPPERRWRAASTASAATGCSAISLFTAAR